VSIQGGLVRRRSEDPESVLARSTERQETTMDSLLAAHLAVAANRTFAQSALPNAPTVAARQRLPRRRLRRSTAWKLRRIADRLAPA
jgi:hypothetical protein